MGSYYSPDIVYFYISAILDENTCQVCKKTDGLTILNEDAMIGIIKNYEHGNKDCTSTNGCRCALVGVFKDDTGSSDVVDELRMAGGTLQSKTFKERGI